jgi:small subunit ribosomal protein S3Ae
MPKGGKRGGRVRDKWRDKQWIIINAPQAFGGSVLNYIPVTNPETARGRVIENTLYDIKRQDPAQHQIKIFLELDKIYQGTGTTIFKGHEYAKEFLRSLIRRGSSMVNFVHDYTTSDGYTFRLATVAFSQRRLNSSKKHQIRKVAHQILSEEMPKLTIEQFIDDIKEGKLNMNLLAACKKLASLRHVGIKKSKLISTPESRANFGPKASKEGQEVQLETSDRVELNSKDDEG